MVPLVHRRVICPTQAPSEGKFSRIPPVVCGGKGIVAVMSPMDLPHKPPSQSAPCPGGTVGDFAPAGVLPATIGACVPSAGPLQPANDTMRQSKMIVARRYLL